MIDRPDREGPEGKAASSSSTEPNAEPRKLTRPSAMARLLLELLRRRRDEHRARGEEWVHPGDRLEDLP